jgi:chaperonin GroES
MKMTLRPLSNRILVKPVQEKEQKRGGIFIPDSAQEKPKEGEVIALGTGKRDDDGKIIPFEVKVGDRVLLAKYGGTEITLNDNNYTIVSSDDVLAVLS